MAVHSTANLAKRALLRNPSAVLSLLYACPMGPRGTTGTQALEKAARGCGKCERYRLGLRLPGAQPGATGQSIQAADFPARPTDTDHIRLSMLASQETLANELSFPDNVFN